MKLTPILFRESMKRLINFQWHAHGKIVVLQTTAADVLKSSGHEVVDIKEVLYPPKKKEKIEVIGLFDQDSVKDKAHPDYKAEPCFIFNDNNVLLEGLKQAKVLTNTVEISDQLPDHLVESEKKLELPNDIHSEIKKKIKLSCIFEATQEKLPRRQDPLRPAWKFPREYGIIDSRKNELLCKNLATVCEQYMTELGNRALVADAFFSVPLEAHNKKIQFEMTSELVLTSKKKLGAIADPTSTYAIDLPELHPVDCTVSLIPYNFYEMQDIYTPNINSKWPFIQTAFVHFNHTAVRNVYDKQVTQSQFQGRSLLKGFCIAAAQARALFGEGVKELPEPVVVPVVHTDGKMFHFTIFQLNTLNLDKKSDVKNAFWNSPEIDLYRSCEYNAGRPVLDDYNPDVIKKLISFCGIE